jgi:hypothetical protein
MEAVELPCAYRYDSQYSSAMRSKKRRGAPWPSRFFHSRSRGSGAMQRAAVIPTPIRF